MKCSSTPTESLYYIRKNGSHNTVSLLPEWDVLAQYVQIGTEEESQEPPLLRPAIPSRESYLALLDAFEAVYQNRKNTPPNMLGITLAVSTATPRR